MYMHFIISNLHFIPSAFSIFIFVLIHIGSLEGVTLLEFEAMGEEDQQETQQQEGLEEGESA
jgi:hypothetical protein